MGLWDALSGRNLRWDNMISEANANVCRALKDFVSSRLDEYPKAEQWFIDVRNHLYAYFVSAQYAISTGLDSHFQAYKDRLICLNAPSYLCLICSLHARSAMLAHSEKKNTLELVFDGICEMYARQYKYAHDWLACLRWLEPDSEKNFPVAVTFKMCDEIEAILDLPAGHTTENALWWGSFSSERARTAFEMFQSPDWPKAVEAEIAAHS